MSTSTIETPQTKSLSPAQRALLLELDRRGLLPRPSRNLNFIDFLQEDRPSEWFGGRHIDLLASELEAVARGEVKRLMVLMPPRHIKSELISRKFPAWYLGTHPDKSIILCSYGADLAEGFSREARNTLEARAAWFGVGVASDSRSVSEWHMEGHRGGLVAAGVGGPITGKGANIAIIDDPLKGAEEANSEVIRQKLKDWYRSVLRTRLTPHGAIILVMTCWHQDDLGGWLREQAKTGGEQWRVVSLPAIAEADDLLGRTEGEALWPEMFGLSELLATKQSLGSYLWQSLYQQNPQPGEGARFRRSWFRYARLTDVDGVPMWTLPGSEGREDRHYAVAECYRIQTVDTAMTAKQTSDYFVCSTWDVTPDADLMLVDVFRERAETVRHMDILRGQFDLHQPSVQLVEQAVSGYNLIQEAQIVGLPVVGVKADIDKVSRSLPMQARYEAGKVYHRADADWIGDVESELLAFPIGTHDDFVDTASMAGIELMGRVAREPEPALLSQEELEDLPQVDERPY